MKVWLKLLLTEGGIYPYIRYSCFFYCYAFFFKRSILLQHKREVSFYKSFLPSHCKLIFDIGAYDGHKTAAFTEISKRTIACEPDEYNYSLLKIRFRNKKNKVFLEKKAVSDINGMGKFYIHHPGSAFNTMNSEWVKLLEEDEVEKWNEKIKFEPNARTVETTTIDTLISRYGMPDFIKIDTEGYEQRVLKGLSVPIPFITFECMLPDFRWQLEDCVGHIENLPDNYQYNIAEKEKLLLPAFVGKTELMDWVEHADIHHFELVAKMR